MIIIRKFYCVTFEIKGAKPKKEKLKIKEKINKRKNFQQHCIRDKDKPHANGERK